MISPTKLALLFIVGLLWNLISVNQALGTTITENFTTITQKDVANSTADWNFTLSLARTGFAVDTNGGGYSEDDTMNIGNGADGTCTFTAGSINTSVQSVFNCTTLTVNAGTTTVTGSNPLIFHALGAVTITGILSADGSVGATGGAGICPAAGGTPGGGGFGGGSSRSGADGNAGSDGGTGGAGGGGLSTTGGGSFSGGGGGASYGSSLLGANGVSVTVAGGNPGTAYGNQNNFNLIFEGGSGGGAGGGHTAPTACGGGGGGSGGSVFLQTIGDISNTGTISTAGGAAGTSGGSGGAGGAAGDGRIRLEDRTGAVGGAITPNAQMPDGCNFISTVSFTQVSTIIQSVGYDITEASPTYLAPTITDAANGGTIVYEFAGSLDNTSFSAFVSLANITLLNGLRFIKFRATLQRNAGTPGTSPIISSIAFNTSGVPYTNPIQVSIPSGNSGANNFSTGIGCGLIKNHKNSGIFSISIMLLILTIPFFLIHLLKSQADA